MPIPTPRAPLGRPLPQDNDALVVAAEVFQKNVENYRILRNFVDRRLEESAGYSVVQKPDWGQNNNPVLGSTEAECPGTLS